MKLLAALVFSICYSTIVFGKTLYSNDFENGDFGNARIVGNTNNASIVSAPSPVCSGGFSTKVVLKANDRKTRTELTNSSIKNFEIGSEYWVGFAIYLPSDWKLDTSRASADVVWQLHGVPDKVLGESYRSPPFSLRISKDKWSFINYSCAKKVCGRDKSAVVNLGKWQTGKWVEFVLHFKLSYKKDGFIEIWKDGKSLAKLKGPNTYNDEKGPYMKHGIYKSAWGKSSGAQASGFSSRKLYYDKVVVGDKNESFNSVAPNCGKSSGKSSSLLPPKNLSIK